MKLAVRGGSRAPVKIGAVYTIGLNYRDPAHPDAADPLRPLVYGKASSSLAAAGATISWDRSLTAKVNGECELGVVVGNVADNHASVLGYTIVNDVTSQDEWLDGDQWLLGKSLPGFCPCGPDIVLAHELDPRDLGLGFRVNHVVVQDGRTSQMRFSISQILDYLGRHIALQPGDLIATGTPTRIGSEAQRYLQRGDTMTCWIEGIGELTNDVA